LQGKEWAAQNGKLGGKEILAAPKHLTRHKLVQNTQQHTSHTFESTKRENAIKRLQVKTKLEV
jgi:hypothetical protein